MDRWALPVEREVQREKSGESRKHCLHGGKGVFAYPVRKIDDIFREHNQEATHQTNLGMEGTSKITIESVKNTETWNAVRGYLGRYQKRKTETADVGL